MYDPRKKSRVANVTTFLQEARDRYAFGLQVDQIDRAEAQADNAFANAADSEKEQWDKAIKDQRKEAYRPVLQWNRIPTYVQQVVNDGRQNKPAIKIAAGDNGEKHTADFFQSRIRQLEYDCDADIAYDTARDQQVTSGRGFIRVSTEWIPKTFPRRQKLCIEPIENQFSVIFDPAAKKYDRSDAEWCFVIERISKEKHERDYGKESIVSRMDFTSDENPAPQWIGVGENGKLVQVAQYWCKEYRQRVLCNVSPGEGFAPIPMWKDEIPESEHRFILEEREEQDAVICCYIINGAEILEETEWIGSTIPIVPVWGRTAVVNGRRRTFSLIRQAKDPQRLVNLYVSNIAEQIAMMPKAPYIAAIGSIPQHMVKEWQEANTNPKATLFYQEWDNQGHQLSPPSRVITEPPIQALTIGLQQAIDGIKAAMGIFDASIGARSNETSGIAIERRKKSSEVVNFHFPDNEARSRKRLGEILIELIPKLDKAGMNVPIRSEDGKTTVVPIGKPYPHPKTGEMVTHDLTRGDYGVMVATGQSYDSARQEENERDAALITAVPELMGIIGDLYMRTEDTPGAEDRADRLKKWIQMKSPGLIVEPGEQKPLPPEVQAQFVQLQQELQVSQAHAQSLFEQLQTKKPELDNALMIKHMELNSKDSELDKNLAFKREELAEKSRVELAKLGIGADIKHLEMEIDSIKHRLGLETEASLHAQKLQAESEGRAMDQQHEQKLQEGQQAHEAGQAEATRQHTAEMADKGHEQTLEQQKQAADLAPEPVGAKK